MGIVEKYLKYGFDLSYNKDISLGYIYIRVKKAVRLRILSVL